MEEVEEFHGCYLLSCLNSKFKGRTYIGYTVNPERRIAQHNAGSDKGGACRTSGKGPWSMTLVVHGFPNEISALRFEWAWTYPFASRRLRHLFPVQFRRGTHKGETKWDYCVRVMLTMVNTAPWNRLPLTVRWLDDNFRRDFPPALQPPLHMPVALGWIKVTKVKDDDGRKNRYTKRKGKKSKDVDGDALLRRKTASRCASCRAAFSADDASLVCLLRSCSAEFHSVCLAKRFLDAEVEPQLIPVQGACPACGTQLLWGDLVRFKRGCYRSELGDDEESPTDDGHWADVLSQR